MIPAEEVSTERGREPRSPAEIPLEDAVANVSAAAPARPRPADGRPRPDRRRPRATASTRTAGASSSRARWSSSTRPRSSAPSGRRSPAPGPPSWSGPPGRTPARSPRRSRSATAAGPRRPPSAPWAPTSRALGADWMIQIGLVELALGGLLGWAMVLRQESPDFLRRIGVVAPQRIRQVHLDYVMMGLILIASASPSPTADGVAMPLVFGTAVNPFLFVPLAFDPSREAPLVPRVASSLSRGQRRPRRRRDRRALLASRATRPGAGSRRCRSRRPCA